MVILGFLDNKIYTPKHCKNSNDLFYINPCIIACYWGRTSQVVKSSRRMKSEKSPLIWWTELWAEWRTGALQQEAKASVCLAVTGKALAGWPIKKYGVKGTKERSRSQEDHRAMLTRAFISKTEGPLTGKTEGFWRAREWRLHKECVSGDGDFLRRMKRLDLKPRI